MATDEEMIPVPRRLLEELLGYLEPNDAEGVVVPGGNGRWTPSMIERLHPELDRYPAAKAVLDIAASRRGEQVSLEEIKQQVSDIDEGDFKPQLGALSKATRRLFGRKCWPMNATQGSDGMYYAMPSQVAEWWNAANKRAGKK